MAWFLAVFLATYTAMHLFVYSRVRALLPTDGPVRPLVLLFLLFMILAPVNARLSERSGHELLAQGIGWMGYPWMGFVFLAFWGFFFTGVLDLVFRVLGRFTPVSVAPFSGRGPTAVVLLVVGLVWVYGFFEARWVRVERVTLPTSKLPAEYPRLRIAQISDVHLGILTTHGRLGKLAETIRSESPDLLVCTGDLVDGNAGSMERFAPVLRSITAPMGKYAVTGNHEFYVGVEQALAALDGFGFKVLRGARETVGGVLNVAGVDDPTVGAPMDESTLLSSQHNGLFTLFLKHRPEVGKGSEGLFDLQLSGHTHRGQIFPFGFFTGLIYPMQDGFYRLSRGSNLYTSRGSGTWGPPLRVLSPPEVTVIDLVPVPVAGGPGNRRASFRREAP